VACPIDRVVHRLRIDGDVPLDGELDGTSDEVGSRFAAQEVILHRRIRQHAIAKRLELRIHRPTVTFAAVHDPVMNPVVLEELSFRACDPEDEDFLRAVYASTREAALTAVNWDDEERDAFVRMQFDAQSQAWAAAFPACERLVILVDGTPAGRLFVDSDEERVVIVDVALLPAFRGRGLGTRVTRLVLDQAGMDGLEVRSHVEKSNDVSLKLHDALGFVPVGEDDVYVSLRWSIKDLAPMQADDFDAYVGKMFGCTAAHGGEVRLELARVVRSERAGGPGRSRAPFTLIFVGDADPYLPQARRGLTLRGVGGFVLFLVPHGARESGPSEYHAVFT